MAKSTERIERTLRNMERLANGGANPQEISVYLRSEGYDLKSFATAVGKYNQSQGVIAEFGPVRSALQGLSFGFSDEAEAGIKALLGKGTYEQNLAALGLAKEEFQQQSPGTALATELIGGVPYMFAGGLGAMKTLGTLPQMARVPKPVIATGGAAGAGGISAGISGAGTAEPGQRMAGAAEMAPIGAAFGVGGTTAAKVLPKVPGVQQLGELGRRMIGAESGFAQRADIKLLQALQRDGISPADAMARLQAIKSSNYKPETIIELGGENTRRLADIVAQYPGASQAARALAEERGAGAGQRVMQDFRQAFQVNADAMDLTESLTRQREQLARPLYQKAYSEGGVIKDERITKLMQIPQFQDAYARARRIAALDGIPLPEKASDIGKVGGFDLQTLDYIKRGLDDVLFTGKQPGSGIGKTELSKLKERRKEFVDIVDEIGPESYKQARNVYSGTTEILEAIDDGKKFATLDPRALQRKFDSLNESEKEAFKIGVYDSIRTNINKGADGADVLRRVWKSPEKRDQLKVFLGDDTYNDLSTQLARENVIRQTDIKLTGGSPTQPRQLAQREFEGKEGLIPQVATGGMRGGLNYLLRTATGPGQPTAEVLSPILFSTDIGQQIQALTRLQTLDELLRRQAAGLGGAIGTGAGTATGLLGE